MTVQDFHTATENVNKMENRLRELRDEMMNAALTCLSAGQFQLPSDREDVEQLVLSLADPDSDMRKRTEESSAMALAVKGIKDLYLLKNPKKTDNGTEWSLSITRDGTDTYHLKLTIDKIDSQEEVWNIVVVQHITV